MFPTSLPTPRIIDPNSVPSLRWGIVGAGWIADAFANALHKHTGQKVHAVASRDRNRGEAFATKHGVPLRFDSYEALVSSPEVDAVYIATLQRAHLDHALLAVNAGKPVLVEKPFTIFSREAEELHQAAKAAGVLAMEAMWTRYLPQSDVIDQLLSDGVFGELQLVTADFTNSDVGERLRFPEDGGALLDLGIYPIAWTSFALGAPSQVHAIGSLAQSGVDEQSVVTLSYESGAQAVVTTGLNAMGTVRASIAGSEATLEMDYPFFTPSGFTLRPAKLFSEPLVWQDRSGIVAHEGLGYQATAFASYIAAGITDSPLRPLAQVVEDIRTIETARHQLGAWLTGEH